METFYYFTSTYLLYIISLFVYEYLLVKELKGMSENVVTDFLELSCIEQIKVLFLSTIGLVPILNTLICLVYGIEELRKLIKNHKNKQDEQGFKN